MWLTTTFGFFSIVLKRGDTLLTVRARVRADLDKLRGRYLPELSQTVAVANTDYKYRATVSHAALAKAMAAICMDLAASNFKAEVERVQGHARAEVYSEVWHILHQGLPPLDTATGDARRDVSGPRRPRAARPR